MQLSKAMVILTLFIFVTSSAILIANAQPPEDQEGSLSSGYRVTNDWHGIDTPLGSDVTVNATTTDSDVAAVMFIWRDPSTGIQQNHTDNTPTLCGTYNGANVYCFEDVYNGVDIMGDWGVQALFIGPDGTVKEQVEAVIAIRATSFNVIPEIPLIGTIGASMAMIGAFGFKLKRRNQVLK